MRTVTVLATGGTIASRTAASGEAVARASGSELVARSAPRGDVRVLVDDVFRIGSYLMSLERMRELTLRAHHHLREESITGLVVTHGTDTAEETALFLDLFLDDERPVVLTGAQRPADAPDSDGPRNLAEAIAVAADPASRGLGTLIVFDGSVFAAGGTRKSHTLATSAFASPDGGVLGWVRDRVHITGGPRPRPRPRLDLPSLDLSRARVDIVSCYPGADATALRAFAAAGARGLVLEATGAGNANAAICEAVAELTASGVVVATSTRVASGPVAAIYGNGGGADLLAAGAVPTGLLRPSQTRVLLAALLGVHGDPRLVREELAAHTGG
ncbi:asparaginase [Streptomyces zingiberis]|uniref:asparaginase n=1 Tax=Streptomyces zingiberis TaxID=2053010 RepID=A0ABX1BU17_9ACTN|nr:asparaginase [Streptomyces zingiberis]NJQ00035.1 asparaginase [Streptomyces zingiberis]